MEREGEEVKAVEFCYWLQGFFELVGAGENTALTAVQTTAIRRHLALVFKHEIDPSYSSDPKVQADMNAIHAGKKKRPRPPRPGSDGETVYRC